MVPGASTSDPRQREPLFDVHPRIGISFEVFYSDRTLETFGRVGPGWFWWSRRRGLSPDGPATGPFATAYAAYRHAMNTPGADRLLRRSDPPPEQPLRDAATKRTLYEKFCVLCFRIASAIRCHGSTV
jgi:hypothetical protein